LCRAVCERAEEKKEIEERVDEVRELGHGGEKAPGKKREGWFKVPCSY